MSNKSQRGDIYSVVMIAIVAVLAAFFIVSTYLQNEYDKVYAQWTIDCRELGGVVQNVNPHRSECFVNNEKVVVKGYEKYQENASR